MKTDVARRKLMQYPSAYACRKGCLFSNREDKQLTCGS